MFASRLPSTLGVLAAIAALLVVVSVAAGATVAPSPAARAAIIRAFGDPAGAAPCLVVRLAASDHDYGAVAFRTTQACERWAFNGTNVLERGHGGHWRVLFEGSSYRCPLPRIPRQVQHDLRVCPA